MILTAGCGSSLKLSHEVFQHLACMQISILINANDLSTQIDGK